MTVPVIATKFQEPMAAKPDKADKMIYNSKIKGAIKICCLTKNIFISGLLP